jgi:hypothetical protein
MEKIKRKEAISYKKRNQSGVVKQGTSQTTAFISANQMESIINQRLTELEKSKKKVLASIGKVPKSLQDKWLEIQHRGEKVRFYQANYDLDKKQFNRVYLTKADQPKVKLLAQQSYDQKILRSIRKEEAALVACLAKYQKMAVSYENIYSTLDKDRQVLVTPITPTAEQKVKAWLAEPYPSMTKYAESATYLTEKGEYVRSKSELMIADRLYHAGIPYKYECPLEFPQELHAESGKTSRFYPDFTIYLPEQEKELYWEHFGLMSDADYLAHAISKLSFYQRVGLLQSGQLILTFEAQSTNLDPKEITEIIERIRN